MVSFQSEFECITGMVDESDEGVVSFESEVECITDMVNEQEASSASSQNVIWLPAVISRPVLPLEEYKFGADVLNSRAAVQLAQSRELPLAALTAMPAREGSPNEQLGVTLQIKKIVELPGGGLEVSAIGAHRFRVIDRTVLPCQTLRGEPAMSNAVSVEWLDDECTPTMAVDPIREHVLTLLRAVRATPFSDEEVPQNDADLSWWVAARLPLPPVARGVLLHVITAKERLSVCAKVLAAAAKAAADQPESSVNSPSVRSML